MMGGPTQTKKIKTALILPYLSYIISYRKRGIKMFGTNKKAILHTNLIVKVRKYKNEQPYFSLHNKPAIADETKARLTVEKLNEIAELGKEENWQTQYYSINLTL